MKFDLLMLLACLTSLTYLTVMFSVKKERFDIRDMRKGKTIYVTAILIILAPVIYIPDLPTGIKILIIVVSTTMFISNISFVRSARKLRGLDNDENK